MNRLVHKQKKNKKNWNKWGMQFDRMKNHGLVIWMIGGFKKIKKRLNIFSLVFGMRYMQDSDRTLAHI